MSNNKGKESTATSIKFTPMPMSQLLANLPLQAQNESPNISSSSDGDSDSSFSKTVAKKPSPKTKLKQFSTPSLKVAHSKDIKAFASEKKVVLSDNDKENFGDVWSSHQTYPNKTSHNQQVSQANKNVIVHPNSEVKTCNVLSYSHNTRPTLSIINSANKKTPEMKPPSSSLKLKTSTPIIKSGIRKFTPGSGRNSNKKLSVVPVIQNRDRVRCELFSQKPKDSGPKVQSKDTSNQRTQPESGKLPPPEPETPVNRKVLPASYVATPSYPQNAVSVNSKKLFKITTIKDRKYMFLKKLGTGGSSEVYKVLEVSTSCEYAVKFVNLATDQELAQGYINEVRLLRELQGSDRVIRLFDYEYDHKNQFLRMVLEVGETDLSSFLKARGAGLPPALVLHYWEEMLHAVNYIHEHGVIHADLKPANFLLVSGRLKLIDFGIASAISSDATSVVRAQATGTYSYISPEALMGGAGGYGAASDGNAPIKISFRSDVWSLGCILYSMVYGRTPFSHIPSLAKLTAILNPNHKIDYPPVEHLPSSLIAALKWCLTYNARARPSVRELLSIPYLQPAPRGPLPMALTEKLQQVLTPQEYRLLMARLT